MKGSLAYLKGALADGHVYDLNSRIRIVLRQKERNWLEYVIGPILKEISGKEPRIIRTSDNVHMIYVYIHKNNLKQEMVKFLLNNLNKVKFNDISDEIKFVRGFFDAEGSLYNSKKKNDKRIIMYQKHKEVLEYIREILKKINIPSKVYGPYKNGKNYIYRLIVFTKKNVEKFLKEIKPSNKSKFRIVVSARKRNALSWPLVNRLSIGNAG